MLRLLVTPRWIGMTVFMVVAVVACAMLGSWQYGVSEQKPVAVPVDQERAAPLNQVLAGTDPQVPFTKGLRARAVGRYTGEGFTVQGVDANGATAAWAVHPFVLDGSRETVAVVRGAASPAPSAPHEGDVVLTGRLQPPAPDSVRDGLSEQVLEAKGLDPRGYLVLIDQQPPDERPAEVVTSPSPDPTSPGRRWQNTMYAFQWWFFGLFTVFAWGRFFRDDLRQLRRESVAA